MGLGTVTGSVIGSGCRNNLGLPHWYGPVHKSFPPGSTAPYSPLVLACSLAWDSLSLQEGARSTGLVLSWGAPPSGRLVCFASSLS